MNKLFSLALLGILLFGSTLFALNYGGFVANFSVTSIQNLFLPSSINIQANGIGSANYTIQCNYDNWHVIAYGAGLYNTTQNSTISLNIANAIGGAAAPATSTFTALYPTNNNAPVFATGNYCGVTPASYDIYFWVDTNGTTYRARKAGYYGTYINMNITDNI